MNESPRRKKPVQVNIKDRISRFLDYLNQVLKNITFGLFVCFISLGFGQVIFRYVLRRPVTWAEGLSRYIFVWSVFLGAALVSGVGEHISLYFFTDRLPARINRYLRLSMNLVVIGLVTWLFVFDGFRIVKIVHSQLSPAVDIPMSIPYLSVLVGGILIILNLAWKTVTQWEARQVIRRKKK